MRRNGGALPGIWIDPIRIYLMTSAFAELTKVLELCASIAFAEWMHIIYIANNSSATFREFVGGKIGQKSIQNQTTMYVIHSRSNQSNRMKLAAALVQL